MVWVGLGSEFGGQRAHGEQIRNQEELRRETSAAIGGLERGFSRPL
jgi:hypothetical protein